MRKKIVCLGGGSLYFRRALPDLLLIEDLSGSEIVLYDIDAEKIRMMANTVRGLAEKAQTGFSLRGTTDLSDAVEDADFAVSSIGGSGAEVSPAVYDSYYHRCDMHIPAKYGIQQIIGDTAGPAGMMMAFRSLAAYMPICREMEKRCPRVVFLNHSNPMAVLCRAMRKHTDLNVIGVCHGVQHGIRAAAELLNLPADQLECFWIGTNHYYWFTRITHQGQDVYPRLKKLLTQDEPHPRRVLCSRLSSIYGQVIVYPSDDHVWEFYPFASSVKDFADLPESLRASARKHGYDPSQALRPGPSSSTQDRQAFLKKYQEILDKASLPDKAQDSVAGEGLGAMISAVAHGRRELAIVNIPNEYAIPNLPPSALVEVQAVTESTGVRALQMGPAPQPLKGMLEKRFAWQELVADAGVKGDRNLALQALLLDEMAIHPDKAEPMLDELLTASKDLLYAF